MGDSRRLQVRDHVVDLLSGLVVPAGGLPAGASKPAGLAVHTRRTRPIEKDNLPAQVVYLVDEDVAEYTHEEDVARELAVIVESRVVADDIEAELDPLMNWAVQVLLADPTLGGLAVMVREQRLEWAAAETDKVYGGSAIRFLVTYRTAIDNPEAES